MLERKHQVHISHPLFLSQNMIYKSFSIVLRFICTTWYWRWQELTSSINHFRFLEINVIYGSTSPTIFKGHNTFRNRGGGAQSGKRFAPHVKGSCMITLRKISQRTCTGKNMQCSVFAVESRNSPLPSFKILNKISNIMKINFFFKCIHCKKLA